ncbi:MAG: hypothetical protein WCG04_05135 [Alphaproteobacteria bacterium]
MNYISLEPEGAGLPRSQEGPRNDGESESFRLPLVIASEAKRSGNVDIFKLFGYTLYVFFTTLLLLYGQAVQAANNNDEQYVAMALGTFSEISTQLRALIADYLPGHETIVFIDNFASDARPHVQSLDFIEEPGRVLGLSDAILAGFTNLKIFRYLNTASKDLLKLPVAVTDSAFLGMSKVTHLHIVGDQFTDAAIAHMLQLTSLIGDDEGELTNENLSRRLRFIREGAREENF